MQHAFREGRELAFVGAGLAASVSDVINDDVLTFLRRAERHALGPVPRSDVQRAFREPIEMAGRSIGNDALHVMVEGASGYPFLLQLVGAQTWRVHPTEGEITVEDATLGVTRARRRMGALIHEPALTAAASPTELIYSHHRGYVDFTLPYLREYLRESPGFSHGGSQRSVSCCGENRHFLGVVAPGPTAWSSLQRGME